MKVATAIKRYAQRMALVVPLGLVGLAHAQAPEPLAKPNVVLVGLGEIQSMVNQPHQGYVIAGTFTEVAGSARNGLARMQGRSLDTAWDPNPTWLDAVPQVPRRVKMAPDGGIFVSGDLIEIGGHAVDCIVKLKPGGELDASWTAPTTNCDFDPVFDRNGWMYFIDSDGSVRRSRADIGGTPDPEWRHQPRQGANRALKLLLEYGDSLYVVSSDAYSARRIAKVNPSRSAFIEVWSRADDVPSSVMALQQSETGELVVGYANGFMRRLDIVNGDPAIYDLQAPDGLRDMKLDYNGDFYVASAGKVTKLGRQGGVLQTYEHAGRDRVNQLWPDGADVMVAGKFAAVGGFASQSLLFIPEDPGSLPGPPAGFEVTGPGTIEDVVAQPNGGAIVRGDFIKADKLPRQDLFRLTPAGQVDPFWSVVTDDAVSHIAVGSDNRVYLGGAFRWVNNFPHDFLARVDGATGQMDFSWWPFLGLQSPPQDISLDTQDRLYVAPRVSEYQLGVQRVLPDSGDADQNWIAHISPVVGIDAIGDKLYVRHSQNPYSAALNRFAQADGAAFDSSWNVFAGGDPGKELRMNAVVADAVGDIVVGGDFDRVFGANGIGGANLVRVSAASAEPDVAWQPDVNGPVDLLAVDTAGEIYVAGRFDSIGGQASNGLVRLSPVDGSLRSDWIPAHGASAICLADAKLFVVGTDWRKGFVALPLVVGPATAIER